MLPPLHTSGSAREKVRVKFQRCWKMLREILPVVAAWINVRFVGDVTKDENFVQRRSARFEAKVVLIAAIEIDS